MGFDNHMRDRDLAPGEKTLLEQQQTDYQPKHMKHYTSSMSHCCFAGCTPMGCPGRCCVQELGHRADCPSNPFREMDESMHDMYVAQGMRKHLAKETA